MHITATHVAYFFICYRKLWLFSNSIVMEHTSELVADGKHIGETTYPQRPEKYTEIAIAGSKIDFYDANNKVVHEIKKSDSMESAHVWQVKYYIWLLAQNGIEGATGILEYPKLREKTDVVLADNDSAMIEQTLKQIKWIAEQEDCPSSINSKICKHCSYYDFCYIED